MFIWIRTGSFLFWSFGKAVVICENAQDITDTFDDFDYSIYQMDWWLFPLGIKRMLPLVLMNSQKPVVVQSFGNLICSRLTFKSVNIFKFKRTCKCKWKCYFSHFFSFSDCEWRDFVFYNHSSIHLRHIVICLVKQLFSFSVKNMQFIYY